MRVVNLTPDAASIRGGHLLLVESPKYVVTRVSPPDMKASGGRLRSIDVFRGLAALGVLLCHIKYQAKGAPLNVRYFAFMPLALGTLGVPLFVVLSGFCIHLTVARRLAVDGQLTANWGAFWRRRF